MVTTKTLTVSQNNLDPAFENAKAGESTLSILYQQDGLSFLVRHTSTRQVYLFGFHPRQSWGPNPISEVLAGFPELPGEVLYAVEAPHTVLIPEIMSSAEVPAWTTTVLGQKANFMDLSSTNAMTFLSYLNETDISLSQSDTLVCRHNWAVQLERLIPSAHPKLWVHVYADSVQIFASSSNKWQVINSFPCSNESELLYHLGNVSEQLNWDRTTTEVELSGYSARAYKPVIEPYFSGVQLFKPQQWAKISSALADFDAVAFANLLRL